MFFIILLHKIAPRLLNFESLLLSWVRKKSRRDEEFFLRFFFVFYLILRLLCLRMHWKNLFKVEILLYTIDWTIFPQCLLKHQSWVIWVRILATPLTSRFKRIATNTIDVIFCVVISSHSIWLHWFSREREREIARGKKSKILRVPNWRR